MFELLKNHEAFLEAVLLLLAWSICICVVKFTANGNSNWLLETTLCSWCSFFTPASCYSIEAILASVQVMVTFGTPSFFFFVVAILCGEDVVVETKVVVDIQSYMKWTGQQIFWLSSLTGLCLLCSGSLADGQKLGRRILRVGRRPGQTDACS